MHPRLVLLGLAAVFGLGCVGCAGGGARIDGRSVLFVRQSHRIGWDPVGPIYAWQMGSTPTQLSQSRDAKAWPQWSPDGKRIAFYAEKGWNGQGACEEVGCADEVWVTNADGSGANQVTSDSGTGDVIWAGEPSWSPDGRRIAYMRGLSNRYDGEIVVLTLRTLTERPLGAGDDPAWGPRGIAYISSHGLAPFKEIRLLNPETGRWKLFAQTPAFSLGSAGGAPSLLAWSRTGELAALEKSSGRLVTIYTDSGRRIRQFQAPGSTACGITWSPDGKHLLITTGTPHLGNFSYWNLYEVNPSGTHWQLLPVHPSMCTTSWG